MDIDDRELRDRMGEIFRYATVGRCVNGVTHDVNNYLGAMMAYAELIGLDVALTDDARGMLAQIVAASEKCSQLVNGLTNVARLNIAGSAAVDIRNLINMVVLLRSYEHKINAIKIEVELSPVLPNLIADPNHLQLALMHLLMNAQEATQETPEKCIRIRGAVSGTEIQIEFWNSGEPLTPQEAEAFMQPFTTTKGERHLGLGLAVASDIAKQHGGSLAYTPERGFILSLPMSTSS